MGCQSRCSAIGQQSGSGNSLLPHSNQWIPCCKGVLWAKIFSMTYFFLYTKQAVWLEIPWNPRKEFTSMAGGWGGATADTEGPVEDGQTCESALLVACSPWPVTSALPNWLPIFNIVFILRIMLPITYLIWDCMILQTINVKFCLKKKVQKSSSKNFGACGAK